MRCALSTWLYADRPLDAALRDFKQAGFAEIEVWADKTHLIRDTSPMLQKH